MSDTTERTRGRVVRRVVEVYDPPAWHHDWPEIGRVVRVTRSGMRDGEAYERTGLYVTSQTEGAAMLADVPCSRTCRARGRAVLADVVRSHGPIENRLHSAAVGGGSKDVVQHKDTGGVRSKAGAAVLSALRGVTLSVLRWNGHGSPTAARSRLANRIPAMLTLLRT